MKKEVLKITDVVQEHNAKFFLYGELLKFSLHSEKDIIFETIRPVLHEGTYQNIEVTCRYKNVDFFGEMSFKEIEDIFEIREIMLLNPETNGEVLYSKPKK